MKRCTKCKKEKPLDSFPKNGKTQTGEQSYRASCSDCEKTRAVVRKTGGVSKDEDTPFSRFLAWFESLER